jgi:hypothetical protein
VLRYGGLEARDARGESLDARLAVLSRGIQIRFEAAGTAYPITVSVATSVAAGGPGQAGSRDAEIGASVLACP